MQTTLNAGIGRMESADATTAYMENTLEENENSEMENINKYKNGKENIHG